MLHDICWQFLVLFSHFHLLPSLILFLVLPPRLFIPRNTLQLSLFLPCMWHSALNEHRLHGVSWGSSTGALTTFQDVPTGRKDIHSSFTANSSWRRGQAASFHQLGSGELPWVGEGLKEGPICVDTGRKELGLCVLFTLGRSGTSCCNNPDPQLLIRYSIYVSAVEGGRLVSLVGIRRHRKAVLGCKYLGRGSHSY